MKLWANERSLGNDFDRDGGHAFVRELVSPMMVNQTP